MNLVAPVDHRKNEQSPRDIIGLDPCCPQPVFSLMLRVGGGYPSFLPRDLDKQKADTCVDFSIRIPKWDRRLTQIRTDGYRCPQQMSCGNHRCRPIEKRQISCFSLNLLEDFFLGFVCDLELGAWNFSTPWRPLSILGDLFGFLYHRWKQMDEDRFISVRSPQSTIAIVPRMPSVARRC